DTAYLLCSLLHCCTRTCRLTEFSEAISSTWSSCRWFSRRMAFQTSGSDCASRFGASISPILSGGKFAPIHRKIGGRRACRHLVEEIRDEAAVVRGVVHHVQQY